MMSGRNDARVHTGCMKTLSVMDSGCGKHAVTAAASEALTVTPNMTTYNNEQ